MRLPEAPTSRTKRFQRSGGLHLIQEIQLQATSNCHLARTFSYVLTGCESLKSIEPLYQMPNLKWVGLAGCDLITKLQTHNLRKTVDNVSRTPSGTSCWEPELAN